MQSKQFPNRLLLVLGCALLFAGCSSEDYTVVPVSGRVVLDGETPVADVKIVFMPKGSEDDLAPGPFSTAITDANGEFVLKCRDGKDGAIIGVHRVSFERTGSDFSEEAMEEVYAMIDEARSSGDQEALDAANARLQQLEKRRDETVIPQKYFDSRLIEFEVGEDGTSDATIELNSD
ncbi:MAG: hypothetical protein AAF456_15515 [Planctomycetota bacterium]